MTNAEKYKEVFGMEPDIDSCPTLVCDNCPLLSWKPKCDIHCFEWWNSEYGGEKK